MLALPAPSDDAGPTRPELAVLEVVRKLCVKARPPASPPLPEVDSVGDFHPLHLPLHDKALNSDYS